MANLLISASCHRFSITVQHALNIVYLPRVRKKGATLFLPATLRNANRYSQFFYHHTLQ